MAAAYFTLTCRCICSRSVAQSSVSHHLHQRAFSLSSLLVVRSRGERGAVKEGEGGEVDSVEVTHGMSVQGHSSRNVWRLKQTKFTRHIVNLVKKGKVEEAEEVLGHMLSRRVRPESAVFNSLIAGHGRRGSVQRAFRVFNTMKKRGLLPTNHTYCSMFNACAMAGAVSLPYLTKVREEINYRDVLLNPIASNALISALAVCGQKDDAFETYLSMSKQGMEPGAQTFGGLLQAAARDPVSGLEDAQRVWEEMLACGVKPDLHSYNLLLQCLRDSGVPVGLTQEKKVISSTSSGVSRDGLAVDGGSTVEARLVVSVSVSPECQLTLHLDGRGVRWLEEEEVGGLLGMMCEGGAAPDIRSFHLLASLVLEPAFLTREMEGREVRVDERFTVAAIRKQVSLSNMEDAKALMKLAEQRGLDLGQAGYQALATGCKNQREGMALLEDMKSRGIHPNEFVFGALLGNASRRRQYEYLVALLKEMRHCDVAPNATIVSILSTTANTPPENQKLKRRYNGFKGYYQIWSALMGT